VGQTIERGQVIGSIGDAHGVYLAHLHLELRARPEMPLGDGYSSRRAGWLDPSVFIGLRRP
jgi:murein DD-endopeptidase MepM/ murein hydrolase activator NlpD